MRSTHYLASLAGHSEFKTAGNMREAERQKHLPLLYSQLCFKILSPASDAKPCFYARSCVLSMIRKIVYLLFISSGQEDSPFSSHEPRGWARASLWRKRGLGREWKTVIIKCQRVLPLHFSGISWSTINFSSSNSPSLITFCLEPAAIVVSSFMSVSLPTPTDIVVMPLPWICLVYWVKSSSRSVLIPSVKKTKSFSTYRTREIYHGLGRGEV